MNRSEWQKLAEEQLRDAKTLRDAGRWGCAYYIAGYAVECGLKACVLAYVERSGVIFDNPKFAEKCRTHNLDELVKLASLEAEFGRDRGANLSLQNFWGIVVGWSEESRYQRMGQSEAEKLYEAIANSPDGVLEWIRRHW